MTKQLILILCLFFSYQGNAQYDNWKLGKVVFKNNTNLKGFIRFKGNRIHYKTSEKSKIERYSPKEIEKVYYGIDGGETGYFEYLPSGKYNTSTWLKLVINGKSKLYKKANVTSDTYLINGTNHITNQPTIGLRLKSKNKKPQEFSYQFFIRRESETNATEIPVTSQEKFKLNCLAYFKDCEKITSYLQKDLYHSYEIYDLVDDYNLFCD